MLSSTQKYVLYLLRSCMNCSLAVQNPDSELEKGQEDSFCRMVDRNGIFMTVYAKMPADLKKQFEKKYISLLAHSVNQGYEANCILNGIGKGQFDCIGLKGLELRKLYPNPQMRQMADIDILIRPYKPAAIDKIMTNLGYQCTGKSAWKHDNYVKNNITAELHKRLTDDSALIEEWEKRMWDRAIPTGIEHVFKMNENDEYIFHFIHLYKDFLNGSLGLRRIVDAWLLDKQYEIDRNYVKNQLQEFGMLSFYKRMLHLAKAVMGEEEINDNDETLLQHAFAHGIYGSEKSYKVGRMAVTSNSVKAGKIHSAVTAFLLPYGRMKAQYPILKKCPVLLPLCWAARIWNLLHGDVREYMNRLNFKNIDAQDFAEMKAFFRAGGINDGIS